VKQFKKKNLLNSLITSLELLSNSLNGFMKSPEVKIAKKKKGPKY
jgi:hypothetical protein